MNGPPCPNCHKPTLAVCMSCRGRAGGEAKTIRKLEAANENIKQASAANRGRRKQRRAEEAMLRVARYIASTPAIPFRMETPKRKRGKR